MATGVFVLVFVLVSMILLFVYTVMVWHRWHEHERCKGGFDFLFFSVLIVCLGSAIYAEKANSELATFVFLGSLLVGGISVPILTLVESKRYKSFYLFAFCLESLMTIFLLTVA